MFKLTLSSTLFASLLSVVTLMSVTAQKAPDPIQTKFSPEKCVFPELELPEDFVVYATNGYIGPQLDYAIEQKSQLGARLKNIVVNSPSQPVILILGSEYPAIWDIKWTKNTEIVGVLATGLYPQAVAGLPKETPILTSTSANGAKCGYFAPEPNNYEILNPVSRKLFGQEVKRIFYLSGSIGQPSQAEQELFSSDDTTVESFYDKCVFPELELPEDFVVYAAGISSGRQLDYQIDQKSNQAGTRMDIVVNSPTKPVVLMLGASSPTVWKIQWAEDTEIVGVLATGYHRQAIAGLPQETPILTSTYDNGAECGYFKPKPNNYEVLNPVARKLFGKEVDKIFRIYSHNLNSIGQRPQPEQELVSSEDTSVESFFDYNAPLAGRAGIEAALSKGILREATEQDFQAWSDLQKQLAPEQDVPELAPGYPDAYVILEDFTYPAGLSVKFFLAEGVAPPRGDSGSSVTYDFNTGKCLGDLCPFFEDL